MIAIPGRVMLVRVGRVSDYDSTTATDTTIDQMDTTYTYTNDYINEVFLEVVEAFEELGEVLRMLLPLRRSRRSAIRQADNKATVGNKNRKTPDDYG